MSRQLFFVLSCVALVASCSALLNRNAIPCSQGPPHSQPAVKVAVTLQAVQQSIIMPEQVPNTTFVFPVPKGSEAFLYMSAISIFSMSDFGVTACVGFRDAHSRNIQFSNFVTIINEYDVAGSCAGGSPCQAPGDFIMWNVGSFGQSPTPSYQLSWIADKLPFAPTASSETLDTLFSAKKDLSQ